MPTINWAVTLEDADLIAKLVSRAADMVMKAGGERLDRTSTTMDFTATHLNGCPLDLQRLLEADDFNFAHDFYGIRRHINRETGKLENCFLPRSARLHGKESK